MNAGRWSCLLIGLLWGAGAHAQEDAPGDAPLSPPAAPVPVPDPAPARPPGWWMPPPQEQLDRDAELIPVGRGCVFVPAMSDPSAEPPFLVMRDGERVESRTTGHKAIVPPGKYRVLVGSGVETQMMEHEVEVFEGHCALVRPDWAGLVVHVVDERGAQIRGTYEIFALPSGEDFGLGLGADESRGESLRTWLLRPGRYMITAAGETPRARTDFLTVNIDAGELVQFTLVQEAATGRFLGGGVVDRWEGKTEYRNWRFGLVVGGDLLWNRNDQVVGVAFGNSVTFNAFIDASVRYLHPRHLIYARLQMDEGQSSRIGINLSDMKLTKTIDEIRLDSLYTFRLLTWLGPYLRFGLDSNLFPGKMLFAEGSAPSVLVIGHSGEVVRRLQNPSELRLADPFDPLLLKEGTGVAFDLVPSLPFDIHVRLGFGARQYLVRSLLVERPRQAADPVADCQDPQNRCFDEKRGSDLLGLEATLIGSARLFRFLMLDTELDTLIPFYSSSESTEPLINWRNTVSLRLVSFASLAYVVKMDFNRQLSQYLQVEQRLLLRFTFDIL
jgi:hypothetical protein